MCIQLQIYQISVYFTESVNYLINRTQVCFVKYRVLYYIHIFSLKNSKRSDPNNL